MTYNFDNIAISCDTWQQMERLAEIAEKQGYGTPRYLYSEVDFSHGMEYFVIDGNEYANVAVHHLRNVSIIPFTTFITSHPDYSVEGC